METRAKGENRSIHILVNLGEEVVGGSSLRLAFGNELCTINNKKVTYGDAESRFYFGKKGLGAKICWGNKYKRMSKKRMKANGLIAHKKNWGE